MSTGFYGSDGSGLSTTPSENDATDVGFHPSAATPTMLTTPFDGVLRDSTADIGRVQVSNFPASFNIGNLPGTQDVRVTNQPAVQPVSVVNHKAVQDVQILNLPAVQPVSGALEITNFPSTQNVVLVGDSLVRASLTSGSAHIGSVSIAGVVPTSTTVTNFPSTIAVSNLPAVTQVSGTVQVSNYSSDIRVNNSEAQAIPVRIVGSDGTSTGGSSFDGIIRNTTASPVNVRLTSNNVIVGAPVSLAAGTNVGISGLVGISSLPSISGTVGVNNFPTSFSISNLPSTQTVTGTVAVSNFPAFPSSFSISNLPATQNVAGTVSVSNFPAPVTSVSVNNTAPIKVEVTNPSSGGGTFDGTVEVTNFPTSFEISNFPAPAPVEVTVPPIEVEFPAVQAVSGTVSIDNFPAPAPVEVNFPVAIEVSNLPDVQHVIVDNQIDVTIPPIEFPAVQAVSGTVNVANFPAQAPVEVNFPETIKIAGGYNLTNPNGPGNPLIVATDPTNPITMTTSVDGGGSDWSVIDGFTHAPLYTRPATVNANNGYTLEPTGPTNPMPVTISPDSLTSIKVEKGTAPLDVNIVSGGGGSSTIEFPEVQAVSGTVNIANFPATQDVSFKGSLQVEVGNTLDVTGSKVGVENTSANPLHVNIGNFPTTQEVSIRDNVAVTVANPSLDVTGSKVQVETGATPLNVNIVSGGTGGGTTFDGQLKQAGANVAKSNPLPILISASDVALNANASLMLNGSNVGKSNPVPISITTSDITSANPLKVEVTNQAAGGSSFDGQLKQNGSAVSTTNALPVVQTAAVNFDYNGSTTANQTITTAALSTAGRVGQAYVVRYTGTTVMASCRIEQSMDGTVWTTAKVGPTSTTLSATVVNVMAVDALAPFYRFVFVNSALVQTLVTITTSLQAQTCELPAILPPLPTGLNSIGTVNLVLGSYWNETTTPLSANAVFTGSSRNSSNFSGLTLAHQTCTVTATSDQTGTFRIEQNISGTTWYRASPDITLPAGGFVSHTTTAYCVNFRVVFTNGPNAQNSFLLSLGFSKQGISS